MCKNFCCCVKEEKESEKFLHIGRLRTLICSGPLT